MINNGTNPKSDGFHHELAIIMSSLGVFVFACIIILIITLKMKKQKNEENHRSTIYKSTVFDIEMKTFTSC